MNDLKNENFFLTLCLEHNLKRIKDTELIIDSFNIEWITIYK